MFVRNLVWLTTQTEFAIGIFELKSCLCMDYDDILRSINKKLGPPPRTFTFIDKLTWFRRDKPEWDWQNDDLRHNIENWEKVFREGRLTWGHIIQVNSLMFEKGTDNCPGEIVIWCEKDQRFDADALELTAHKLFELKGYSVHLDDTEEKMFAEYLENQYLRVHGLKVPEHISEGYDLRVSTIFFQRRHIPAGVITNSLFPVLYLESNPMVPVMVPYKFWPKVLMEEWEEE